MNKGFSVEYLSVDNLSAIHDVNAGLFGLLEQAPALQVVSPGLVLAVGYAVDACHGVAYDVAVVREAVVYVADNGALGTDRYRGTGLRGVS